MCKLFEVYFIKISMKENLLLTFVLLTIKELFNFSTKEQSNENEI